MGGGPAVEAERVFLSHCLSAGPVGSRYLDRITDEHLSSEALRRARDHLAGHFDDPLAELPTEDRELAAIVAGAALRADQNGPADEAVLEMGFLQLELRRLDREVRRARADGDLGRQGELAAARQQVRRDMDHAMGQSA